MIVIIVIGYVMLRLIYRYFHRITKNELVYKETKENKDKIEVLTIFISKMQ